MKRKAKAVGGDGLKCTVQPRANGSCPRRGMQCKLNSILFKNQVVFSVFKEKKEKNMIWLRVWFKEKEKQRKFKTMKNQGLRKAMRMERRK